MRDQFEKELKECREYKKHVKKQSETTTPSIRVTDVVKQLPAMKTGNLSFKKKTELHRDQVIVQKFSSLEEGYVMDVTSMKNDGSSIKNRNIEQVKNRGGNISKLPIVSNSIENYIVALKALNIPDKEIEKLSKQFDTKKIAEKPEVKKREPKKESVKKEIPRRVNVTVTAKKPSTSAKPKKSNTSLNNLNALGDLRLSLASTNNSSPRTQSSGQSSTSNGISLEDEVKVVDKVVETKVVETKSDDNTVETKVVETKTETKVEKVEKVEEKTNEDILKKIRGNMNRGNKGFRKSPGRV
jgi:hypothetical protein